MVNSEGGKTKLFGVMMLELYENNLFVRLESVEEKNPTELKKLIEHLKNFQPLKNNPPIF